MANTTYDDDELKKRLGQQTDYNEEYEAEEDEDYNDEPNDETDENVDDEADNDEACDEDSENETDGDDVEEETDEKYANTRDRDVADAKKAIRALRNLTTDDDESMPHNGRMKLSAIPGGDMLGGKWFRKQFWFIVMLAGMFIVYISNRYYCQQEMLETKALNDTLLDRRYKALTRSSQLKEKTRRSYIEETLVDTMLQTANTPSFNLKIE